MASFCLLSRAPNSDADCSRAWEQRRHSPRRFRVFRRGRNSSCGIRRFGVAGAAVAVALETWSSRRTADPAYVTCATAEVRALADGLADGGARQDLFDATSVHKRVWTLADDGYIDLEALRKHLSSVRCRGEDEPETRRRFAVDPWGTAYWVRAESMAAGADATIYSFGPNRRRDLDDTARAGDDIVVRVKILRR